MRGILEDLERSAARFPDKTAVACGDERYSFAALKDAAQRLGAAVAARGLRAEPVGVFVNRSAETAVFFFAAAYSGNFYLPLDPAMPEKRLRAVLEDSGTRLLLGAEANRAAAEALGFADAFLTRADAADRPCEAPEVTEDTPLYLVYTSGSTGRPKGVLKSHGAVRSFLDAFTQTFPFGPDEIIGNQTPFFFDASAKDLYLSLRAGATLEIVPSRMFMLPTALIAYLNERGVSFICWVPTALAMVVQMNAFRKLLPTTLRRVFFVGEPFPIKQLRQWAEALPEIEYVNLLGSSELAGICCWYRVSPGAREEVLPVGRPLPNCRVFLRDGEETVTEPGRTGELCIVSPALALGYYRDGEKTAACFREETLPDGTAARVFHSGDLARYDGEGNLVFVSRKDFQIKFKGERIELGEIESAADALESVQRCCCLYLAEKKQITLFCELRPGSGADERAIRTALREALPDYMLPQRVALLERLPINANGKIDRTALYNAAASC